VLHAARGAAGVFTAGSVPTVRETTKASRLETLGAWLGLWTAPRDVYVPPVPWRKVAAGAGVLVAIGVLVALVVAPAIDDAKSERSAREQRALERRAAARRERQRIEQRPRFGRAQGATRTAVLADVEAAIGADARRRFDPDAKSASCEPTPGADPAAPRVAFDCISSIREIVGAGEQGGVQGQLAIPFRAVVDFRQRRYAFCKVNPPPGEQVIPDPRKIVTLPPACRNPAP